MESKYVKVKASKVEKTIDFYASFGWALDGDKEELPNGKVGLNFERDKSKLEGAYGIVKKGEQVYKRVSRPVPIGALITLGLGSVFLALYFLLQKSFAYYIIFLYASLTFYSITIYLLIVFLIVFLHSHMLHKKIVYSVGLKAGTLKEYPLRNNVLEEEDDSWVIADNPENIIDKK